jgi:hypothetical protein
MKITDVCIRRSVLAWMIMAATILFGLVSASRIGVSQTPDVDSPNVTVVRGVDVPSLISSAAPGRRCRSRPQAGPSKSE